MPSQLWHTLMQQRNLLKIFFPAQLISNQNRNSGMNQQQMGIGGGKIDIKTKCLTNQNRVSQILIISFGFLLWDPALPARAKRLGYRVGRERPVKLASAGAWPASCVSFPAAAAALDNSPGHRGQATRIMIPRWDRAKQARAGARQASCVSFPAAMRQGEEEEGQRSWYNVHGWFVSAPQLEALWHCVYSSPGPSGRPLVPRPGPKIAARHSPCCTGQEHEHARIVVELNFPGPGYCDRASLFYFK